MTELIILGSGAAIPTAEQHNTYMALVDSQGVVLIDCSGLSTLRLEEAGISPDQITDIILTHFHPDHVSGVPLLLMNMWLAGRNQALRIYGLHHTLERVEDLMGFYHWEDWPKFFPVSFHRLPEQEEVTVLVRDQFVISSSPVCHVVPTIGLRFDFVADRFRITYSSDTEPCATVRNLAQDADILIHEATGLSAGHSTAKQAAELASHARVQKLYLIHYPSEDKADASLLAEAQESFSGSIEFAHDLMRIPIPGLS
jgi:ribonuclease Z